MILATPPPVTQAITLPESDSSQSSPELYISTDTEFDITYTPSSNVRVNLGSSLTPVTQDSNKNNSTPKPVTQDATNNDSSKAEVYPASDIRVKQKDGIELSRKPPRTYSKRDARETLNRKRKVPLPHEDARHLLDKIRPLKEDARNKLGKPSPQVGYYTDTFSKKSQELAGYKIPKTSRSANSELSSSENDSIPNSVTQNEPAVQKDPNSVKQNKSNSSDSEHNWSKNIEKGNSYLKRNSYPEYKPSRQIKYKPSEADLKARAEVADMFKDKTTYNNRRNVLPGLFDNLDNILPFCHQVPKVRIPRLPVPPLRDRHTNADHRFIIVGHTLAAHLVHNFKTGLQVAAFKDKEPYIPPILLDSRPSITDVASRIHDHLKTEGIWKVIFADVSTYGLGNNKQKPALIKICNAVNEQCQARHKHPRGQRCRVIISALPPPLDVYTPPHIPLGQNNTLSHLTGMSASVIDEMRWKWWTSHVSFNKNARRLGHNGAADLVDLTLAVPLPRLLHHYEHTAQWPVKQAEARFTTVTLNEMATMILRVLNH